MPVIPVDYIGGDPGKIAIKFFNGTEVVSGYIVKQTGSRRYVVSQDGVTEYKVKLVRTLADLEAMGPGMATIEVFPIIDGEISETPEHAHRVEQFTCYTIEGHKFGWRFDTADEKGEANIDRVP
jgi:hypothetical protein